MTPADCILFSGGAPGAETAFGEAAERHGIEEVNFTFDTHPMGRTRGVRDAQPRRAAGRRREPRVRLAPDEPPVYRGRDDPQDSSDALVSGQQRPGDLRHRHRAAPTAPCAAAPAGAPNSRSCATSRSACSIRRRTAGSGGRAPTGRYALRPIRRSSRTRTSPAPARGSSRTTAGGRSRISLRDRSARDLEAAFYQTRFTRKSTM